MMFTRPRNVALALALGAMTVSPAFADAQDDKAALEVQKLGGRVDRDDKAPGKPVLTVNFATTPADDNALGLVSGLTKIQKLTLNGTKVTDAGLAKIKGLASLKKLYAVDTKLTDAALANIKELKGLEVLSLVGTGVTDAGLDQLKDLKELKELYLYGTKVTPEGIKKLQAAHPKLKIDK